MKNRKVLELVGWYGVMSILVAYSLASFKVVEVGSLMYQLLNLTGALGIVITSLSKKDKQPAVLNVVWASIALVAIIRMF